MRLGLTRFILWDYPRAVWQYDVMVGVILVFIFLTPREFFRDQPRVNHVIALAREHGVAEYWLEPSALDGLSENQRTAKAVELIRQRFGHK
ncbi:MAG: hypothetical protein NTY38_25915, partial [Acidobacteria bacterium]|nr:hypothetical protein [Acidobacteriota bacterium]